MHPVFAENQLAGTVGWQLQNPSLEHELEGYCTASSINKGESIGLKLSSSTTGTVTARVFRTGWYGGIGARQLGADIAIPNVTQQTWTPRPGGWGGGRDHLTDCGHWPVSHTLQTGNDWVTGVYLIKVINPAGRDSFLIFTLRDDSRRSDIAVQTSSTTWHAYSMWPWTPAKGQPPWTGNSVYDFGGRVWRLSYNRPYGTGYSYFPQTPQIASAVGSGEYLFMFGPNPWAPGEWYDIYVPGWEYNTVRWLERSGYDVCYCDNVDLHTNPDLLHRCRLFLSMGHDEYYTNEMRARVFDARDNGTSIAIMGANFCYWRMRFENNNRTLVCYKYDTDPGTPHTHWTFRQNGLPESQIAGVMYFSDPERDGDVVVSNATHEYFRGTGLRNGDRLRGMLGYEVDSIAQGSPSTGHPTYLTELTSSMTARGGVTDQDGRGPHLQGVFGGGPPAGPSHSVVYDGPHGNRVFATGTMAWAWGLDDYNTEPTLAHGSPSGARPPRASIAAQTLTANILNDLIRRGRWRGQWA